MDIESSSNTRVTAAPRYLPTLIAGLWIALFGVTFADLWQRWIQWDSALAHGIPVVVIFLSLLWKSGQWRRQHWFSSRLELAFGLTALLGTSLLWFLAYAVNIQIIEQLLLLPALIFVYATLFGWKTVFHHRILLLFPIFAIPIWGSLNGLLLEAASSVVGELVRLIEMPALIQGNSIYIPYGHILIADGCSGLRYFVIALTLAYLIGYLNGYREPKLLLTLMVAAALGLITNWIRIFVLIVIGYHTRMESGLMEDHELFGWVLFGLICLPAIYFAPVHRHDSAQSETSSRTRAVTRPLIALSLGAMTVGPLLGVMLYWSFDASASDSVESREAEQLATPLEVAAPQEANTTIKRLQNNVFLRRDVYERNYFNEKLVPYLPRLYNHQVWLNVKDETRNLGRYSVRYQTFSEKAGKKRVAQLQWFNVGGKVTASRVEAKLLQVPATLRGENIFSIVTLQTLCREKECDNAYRLLSQKAEHELTPQE
ncbi:exosortase/archaeosortase family protein [Marinimicrobium locisalis]|uniref:exosortase/archaeosortase family protein n=1 Tax=Marinimicrobium locisalis TaxID=546022 RepID=UPI0032218A16